MHHTRTPIQEVVAAAPAPADHTRNVMLTLTDLREPPTIDEATYQQLCWLLLQRYGVVAVERMQRNLAHPDTRLLFVRGRLYVTSVSERGRIHVTDGAACPCRGGGHANCWHRMLWHLLTLWTALVDPTILYSTH